jgi:hypothetical protein
MQCRGAGSQVRIAILIDYGHFGVNREAAAPRIENRNRGHDGATCVADAILAALRTKSSGTACFSYR